MTTQVRIRRSYDVPAQRIYDAWTDPDQIRQWLTRGGTYDAAVRVGGAYQLDMLHDGRIWEHKGTYLHLEPPHVIEFTWITPHSTYGTESLVRIEITDLGAGCEMVLTHTKLPDQHQADQHGRGWTMFAEILAKQVGSA
jgi:uncharacterized protein YndB with AHSA1/START domain